MQYISEKHRFVHIVADAIKQNGQGENLGVYEISKALWFSDFIYWRDHDKQLVSTAIGPVTGFSYIKEGNGPIPEGIEKIVDELCSTGVIKKIKGEGSYGYPRIAVNEAYTPRKNEEKSQSYRTARYRTARAVALKIPKHDKEYIRECSHKYVHWDSFEEKEKIYFYPLPKGETSDWIDRMEKALEKFGEK